MIKMSRFMKDIVKILIFACVITSSVLCANASEAVSTKSLPEKPIVIVVPSYNNVKWYRANLYSLFFQDYSNFRIIYIDDNSPDGTGDHVEEYLITNHIDYRLVEFDDQGGGYEEAMLAFADEVNLNEEFFILVRNTNRCGALENIVRAVHSCHDDEIVTTVDGDDWLFGDQVLKTLNAAYENNVWLTHGTLIHFPTNKLGWSEAVPPKFILRNTFREYKCPSHLRTFYAWLFKLIKLDDLRYQDQFFPMSWDMAMMFPMIEMAGERHAFIPTVTYCYNIANQINDNKVNPQLQNNLDRYIRNMPPYKRLDGRP